MHQRHAVVSQQLRDLAEIIVEETDAHMFEHSHRHDAVEATLRFAIILQAKVRLRAEILRIRARLRHA